MASQISSIWGKKSSHQMVIPVEQQNSMKRFLTPSKGADSHVNIQGQLQQQLNMQQSLQKIYSGKSIQRDESKQNIANFKAISQKYDLANSSSDRRSRVKLPKIKSLNIQTSHKIINKSNSMNPGIYNQSPSGTNTANYQTGLEKLNKGANFNATIREVTGEHFFTKYSQNDFRQDRVVGGGKEQIHEYVIDESAKCICFCQQRRGRQTKCQHADSEDVDEISKTILDQAKDFLSADKHFGEDISQIKEGLEKVEFVRSKNYLSKLAILVSRQEKEIFRLQKQQSQMTQLSMENTNLKDKIKDLNKRMNHQNTYAELCEDDKNFMQIKVHEKGGEMAHLLEKLRDENNKNKQLISQVKSQEIEIRTLLNCVENLRKQVVQCEKKDSLAKYGKYDQMMTIYEGSEQMIKKIKEERTVEVQKDIFDLAMKKITTQAELEMLNLELKSVIDAYAKNIDLKKLGLEFE